MLHLQEFVGGSLNMLADLMTMSRPVQERPQDEHVQGSLEKPDPLLLRLLRHSRLSTLKPVRW